MLQLDRVAMTSSGPDLVGDLPAWRPLPASQRVTSGAVRLGAVGLAAGASIAAWLEYVLMRRRIGPDAARVGLGGGQLGRVIAAASGAAVVALGARIVVAGWPPLLGGVVAVAATAVAYLALAQRLGVTEVSDLVSAVLRRRASGTTGE